MDFTTIVEALFSSNMIPTAILLIILYMWREDMKNEVEKNESFITAISNNTAVMKELIRKMEGEEQK